MYNYSVPPSGYEYYRYETEDSAQDPPCDYSYQCGYSKYPPPYSNLETKQPRRHSRSSATSSYSRNSTSSPHAYDYYPLPYQSTEKCTPKLRSNGTWPSSYSTTFKASPPTQRPSSHTHYLPASTSSEPGGGGESRLPTVPRLKSSTKKPSEFTKSLKRDIPARYFLGNWDPTVEPLLLLGSVFDTNSIGKWIYDWTLSTPKELAGDLWLQLIQQACKAKVLRTTPARFAGLGKLLRVLCLGGFVQLASALPIDSGEPTSNPGWPGGPGLPSISGWPSPCLGLIFAAVVAHFSKPHSTSRMPGAMALVFNYLSLVASGDAKTPPAVLWTLKGLATYFVVFYGDLTFRKFQMGQGYFALLMFLGLIMDYCVAQILQTGQAEAPLLDELFRFSLPTFSLSLCLCAYHAHYKQKAAEALVHARFEERLEIEERLRRENAASLDGNSQPPQATGSS